MKRSKKNSKNNNNNSKKRKNYKIQNKEFNNIYNNYLKIT